MIRSGLTCLLLLAACAQAGSDPDATADNPDAAVGVPDATVGVPDAAVGVPDAMAGLADAATADASVGLPDAATPDASVGIADAATPDATVAIDAGCGWVELLGNGSFEAGTASWLTTTNNPSLQVIRMYGAGYPWMPQAGDWASILGGFDDAVQTMSQNVTVPAAATMLRLSGYGCFVTEESALITEWDTLDILLRTLGGTTLETLRHLSNLDAGATCSWTFNEHTAVDSYAGQTVQLYVAVSNDFSNISSFGFDSLALEAYVCP